MGEFLASSPKNEGQLKKGPVVVLDDRGGKPPTLAEIGISKDQSARAQKLAALTDEEFKVQGFAK